MNQNRSLPEFAKGYSAKGFTVLEMVVSIFLIAIILGGALLLLAANLNVIEKANEMMIATSLAQYTVEDVRNIEFPPVYYDRQSSFGDRPVSGTVYKNFDSVNPADDGNEWTPAGFENSFIVRKYDFRYGADGAFLSDAATDDTDLAMQHRVDVHILKKQDSSLILSNSVIITRNGLQ
ncbi:MAG TPA: prepilin-type N-terminal cleavage/methylation domain-containing protein [bacterium]|nr:prepilin-type N-terminal cleavage/methylation domain-containing protein [bacterium]